ncbi:hypothetical protein NC652_032829 [Populus alba x Populus x berolinensis]|nr:hypothetical protein NC652_032829 [Populus alba x Populus x berolinensis]
MHGGGNYRQRMELLFDHKIQWSASVEQPDMALQNQEVEEEPGEFVDVFLKQQFGVWLESFSHLLTEPKSPPLSPPQVAVVEYFRHLLAAIIQSNRKCKLGQYDSACGYLDAKTSEI